MTESEYKEEPKDWSPHVLNFSHQIPWQVVIPTVFRFMDPQYIQAFKDDGSLRLSSFSQFSKHEDEQRLDTSEGKAIVTLMDGDQSVMMVTGFGMDSYVLCGSISDAKSVSDAFGTSTAIVITDTVQFAGAVARALPGCQGGIQGMCTYQSGKLIHKKTNPGELKEELEEKLSSNSLDMDLINRTASSTAIEQIFMKDIKYAHQLEYRFVWRCENIEDTIDIKVPLAREFCKFKDL